MSVGDCFSEFVYILNIENCTKKLASQKDLISTNE